LEQGPPDPPALPHQCVADVDPAQGQVLPERPRPQLPPQLGPPPLVVLGGVGVAPLVGPAVPLRVALLVPVDLVPPPPDRPGHRVLPDRRPHRLPPVADLPGSPAVHRYHHTRHDRPPPPPAPARAP